MIEDIHNFPKQFLTKLSFENEADFARGNMFVIGGMGGSNLAAGFISMCTNTQLYIHRNYGLPDLSDNILNTASFIAVSHSGNTEETLDFYTSARKQKFPVAVISSGGELLLQSKKENSPFIELPRDGTQPRNTLGMQLIALAKVIGDKNLEENFRKLSIIKTAHAEKKGAALAERLAGNIPVIYASEKNKHIAYDFKIALNETGKVPAFYNIFPELNHNAMAGFDVVASTRDLSQKFHILFLYDEHDDPRIRKRMDMTRDIYQKKGFSVDNVLLAGDTVPEKIAQSIIHSRFTAYALAKHYGVAPDEVKIIEEFKKKL